VFDSSKFFLFALWRVGWDGAVRGLGRGCFQSDKRFTFQFSHFAHFRIPGINFRDFRERRVCIKSKTFFVYIVRNVVLHCCSISACIRHALRDQSSS